MAAKKISFEMESYGIYTLLKQSGDKLPQILKFTDKIPVSPEVEFGITLNITGGKGETIDFEIVHPPWPRPDGSTEPAFRSSLPVRTSPFRMFIGDTFWEPWENKCGKWVIKVMHKEKLILKKSFEMYLLGNY